MVSLYQEREGKYTGDSGMERINGLLNLDIADKCTGYIGRKRINVLVIYSPGRINGSAILGQRAQMDLL